MFKLSKYNYNTKKDNLIYIYNLLTRSFLRLNQDTFAKLENGEIDKLSSHSIDLLLKYGIICPKNINEELVMKNYIPQKLSLAKSLGIILSMTSLCDFNCPYCFEDCRKEIIKNKKYIDKTNIDQVYEYALNEISSNKLTNLSIAYFGGEPLINFSNLQYAIEKFSSIKNISLSQTLVTNGFNMSDDFIIDTILKHNLYVQITLDGPKEIHNSLRTSKTCKKTFDIIVDNIRRLCKIKPQNCILRINVQEKLINEYYSLIDFICSDDILRKIASINIVPIFDGQLKSNCNSPNITDTVLDLYKYIIKKGLHLSINIEFGPCLAQSNFGIAIDENLNTYSCPATLYKKNIGYIKNSRHIITDNSWYRNLLMINPCVNDCKYAPICYGPCILNSTCYKKSIEKLLPVFVEQKISQYECKEVQND